LDLQPPAVIEPAHPLTLGARSGGQAAAVLLVAPDDRVRWLECTVQLALHMHGDQLGQYLHRHGGSCRQHHDVSILTHRERRRWAVGALGSVPECAAADSLASYWSSSSAPITGGATASSIPNVPSGSGSTSTFNRSCSLSS